MRRQTLAGCITAAALTVAGCSAAPEPPADPWILGSRTASVSPAALYQASDVAPAITEIPLEVSEGVGAALDGGPSTANEATERAVVPDVLAAAPPQEVEAPDQGVAMQLDTVDEQERASSPAVVPDMTFQTVAVTWPIGSENQPELQARVRSSDSGTWGEWFPLEADDSAPDAGTVDADREARGGTPSVYVGEADAVQVATVGSATTSLDVDAVELALIGSPAREPASGGQAQNAVYRPDSSRATTVAEPAGLMVPAAVTQPGMVTRAQWGAAAPTCTMDTAARLVGGVVHHTAGPNGYATQAAAMQQIRNDQAYHMNVRGWCDLGYNFVVDKWGNLYEGRAGSMDAAVIGVHAGGFNTGTVGVSVLGTYSTTAMPQAAANTVGRILGWKLGRAGVDPSGSMTYTTGGGENSRYPAGTTVTLRTIFGHRDVAFTACPGNAGYAQLDAIRGVAGANRAPEADCNFVTNTFQPGPAEYSYVFGCRETVIGGDWNGDRIDTLAIRKGSSFTFTNDARGRTTAQTPNFGRPGDQVFVGDWDGDGDSTLAVRRGVTFYLMNEVAGGAADVVFDYGRVGDQVLVGDWNGDGRDTFVVRRGAQYFFSDTLRSGSADHVQFYGRSGDVVYAGNWTGSGGDTLMVRRGNAFYFRHDLASGPAQVVQTFGRAADRIVLGDWNGDRIDTVMVRRV